MTPRSYLRATFTCCVGHDLARPVRNATPVEWVGYTERNTDRVVHDTLDLAASGCAEVLP